ncbi:30S ribosomal protein S4 [Candidatus Woesearchaeota archaeon]|nr:30S ribosomal protein S4 [Candidatus Woesearchaeota archaeon]
MGDPKKQKKKYSGPLHPWSAERIQAEKEIMKEYGLRRKNEIWKMNSVLRHVLRRAKVIIGASGKQAELEKRQLLDRVYSMGLVSKGAKIEDILNIDLKQVMNRRLQTVIARKSLAHTMDQARQFIVHGHVNVGQKKITSPSYLVTVSEEQSVGINAYSPYVSADHPERKSETKGKAQRPAQASQEKAEDKPKKEIKAESKAKAEVQNVAV